VYRRLQVKCKQPYGLYDVELHITVRFHLSDSLRSGKIALTAYSVFLRAESFAVSFSLYIRLVSRKLTDQHYST